MLMSTMVAPGADRSPLAGVLGRFPGASMAADFTKGLYYADGAKILGQLITDARASDIIIPDANGVFQTIPAGQPSRTSKGLGVFAGATQLLTAPSDFSNAAWAKSAAGTGVAPVVTANSAVAPDGTLTADRVDFDRGVGNLIGDYSILTQSGVATSAQAYFGNVYMQARSPADVGKQLAIRHVAGASYQIITLTAEWQRVGRTETSNGGNKYFDIITRGTYTADNAVSVNLWGVNLVAGSNATPVINSQATRAACQPTLVQGSGSIPFPNYTAGAQTFSFDFETPVSATKRGIASLIADSNNRVDVYLSAAGALTLESIVSSASQGSVEIAGVDDGARHTGLVYFDATGALKASVDGGTADTDTGITMPTGFASLSLGTLNGSSQLNGTIKQVALMSGDQFDNWRASARGSFSLLSSWPALRRLSLPPRTTQTRRWSYRLTASFNGARQKALVMWPALTGSQRS